MVASIEELIESFKELETPNVEHYTDSMVTLLMQLQRLDIDVEIAYQRFMGINSVFGVQYNSVGKRSNMGKQLDKVLVALHDTYQFLSHYMEVESSSVQ